MRGTRLVLAAVCLAAIFGMTAVANAQTVPFLGVGSSAVFQTMGVAAYNDLCFPAGGSAHCHHWSAKGKTSGGTNFAQIVDGRGSGNIVPEGGNLIVVWDDSPLTIWAYLSVDTIVGNRAFFAVPRTNLQVDAAAETTAGQGLIGSILFVDGSGDAASLPSNVWSAVQTQFTAAGSDIRPEDAKLGTNRALSNYDALKGNGLGYNQSSANCTPNVTFPSLIGCAILSSISGGGAAHPVAYNITGKDPFNTTLSVPKYKVLDVGAFPLIAVFNGTDASGLGALDGSSNPLFKNLNHFVLASLVNGSIGRAGDLDLGLAGNTTAVTTWLREPLSGTMNTFEFSIPRTVGMQIASPKIASQEAGVNMANPGTNPLNLAGPGGSARVRGIGTGEVTNGVKGVGGVLNTADSVAYTFFSYGNVAKFTPASKVYYVTVDGVDPINALYGPYTFQGTPYTPGQLPICTAPCGDTGGGPAAGTSFPNVRNGSYKIWTIVRIITDASGPNLTNAQALVTAAQAEVNHLVPDFVPFVCATPSKCAGEPGLQVFHSHYAITKIATKPSNGNTGEPAEAGGDIDGGVFPIQADVDFFNDSGKVSQLIGYRD
jgi:hypothetical protein